MRKSQGLVLPMVLIFLGVLSLLALELFRSGIQLKALAQNRWQMLQCQLLARSGVAWLQARVAQGLPPTPPTPDLVRWLAPDGGVLHLHWSPTPQGDWKVTSTGVLGHFQYTVLAHVQQEGTVAPGGWWEGPGPPP